MNIYELYQRKEKEKRAIYGGKLPKRGFTKPLNRKQKKNLEKELKTL